MPQNSISFSQTPPIPPEPSIKKWNQDDFALGTNILYNLKKNIFTADEVFLKSWLPEYFIQELLQKKPIDPEMNTQYVTREVRKGWKKTLHSFGIGTHISHTKESNQDQYYIEYLGKKLLLPRDVYSKMTKDNINKEMYIHLSNAIELCQNYHKEMGIPNNFKSNQYDAIHNSRSVYELLEIYNTTYETYRRGKLKQYSITPESLKRLNFAMFEITRILVILKNLLMWEQTAGNHLLEEDNAFLIRKLFSLSNNPLSNIPDKDLQGVDNPMYYGTTTHAISWKKTENGYLISDITHEKLDNMNDSDIILLESMRLTGKFRNNDTEKESIDLLHVSFRGLKDGKRGVEKRQRKGHISMDEVLDKKGFQFVVQEESDKLRLIKILENELSTLRSGWLEIPESVGNPYTDPDYKCLKGTLLIPHKHKTLKQALRLIDETSLERSELSAIQSILDRKSYTIPVEIQIFTLEEYIKAEYDKDSSVNHGNYVAKQRLGLIPTLYPISIYGKRSFENIPAIKSYIQQKTRETISGISSPTNT